MAMDIGALYEPKSDINRLVEAIAIKYGFPDNSVKGNAYENAEAREFSP